MSQIMAIMPVIGAVLVFLDLVLWILTLGPIWMLMKYMNTPTVWAQPVKGSGDIAIWRSTQAAEEGLCKSPYPEEGVDTLYRLLERSWKRYGDRHAQGNRPLLSWRKDEGFRFPAKVFGETQWRTYRDMERMCRNFGCGLRALGMSAQPTGDFDKLTGKFKILMYEETCGDWMVCMQGAMTQDIVVATAYSTLGEDSVIHAVNEGSVTAIVCNRKAVEGLLKRAPEMPSLEALIYTDASCLPEECASKVIAGTSKCKVLSFQDVLEMGQAQPTDPTPPKSTSVAVLMYTSGSTGTPKGVVVRHSQLLGVVAACKRLFGTFLADEGEMYLGYLPLAHILEMAAEMVFYGQGYTIGYADPKTLLAGPERCYPTGGLEEFRPTLMAGVPKVWETIKKGAEVKLEKSSPAVKYLFELALRIKKAAIRTHRYTPLFDAIVFKKFKNMIGGRMKFTLSGGGAISSDVQEWVRAAFCCPLIQGYGLTETCGGSTIQSPMDPCVGVAGSPLNSVEVALHSEPEITDANRRPYLATDTVHVDGSPCAGRGEVWLRGTSVTSGYYKMPDKTAEDFDKDGWFHTGDIGMFTPAGQLLIVDRKKNLVKLKGGEYVALEMMNVTYNNAPIVNTEAGGVCCYGDHTIDRPVAFVQCKAKELEALAAEAGVTGKTGEALCRDPKVMAAVKAKLDAVAKGSTLPALMHVIAVMPVLEPWTATNGCLTATSKLVSKEVYRLYEKDLETLKALGRRG